MWKCCEYRLSKLTKSLYWLFSKGNNFCLHRQNFFIVLAKFYKVYEPCLTWLVTSNLNKKNTNYGSTNADASGQKAHWEPFFFWVSQCITNETQICKIYQYPRWNILFVGILLLDLSFAIHWIIMSNNSKQKRWRPDAATYYWRLTNNTFYGPAEIILCIWQVGNRMFLFKIGS